MRKLVLPLALIYLIRQPLIDAEFEILFEGQNILETFNYSYSIFEISFKNKWINLACELNSDSELV